MILRVWLGLFLPDSSLQWTDSYPASPASILIDAATDTAGATFSNIPARDDKLLRRKLFADNHTVTPKPLENETHSDHPADLRRIHTLFTAMDDALPEYRTGIEKGGAERLERVFNKSSELTIGEPSK